MTSKNFHHFFYALLLPLFFSAACNGQNQTEQQPPINAPRAVGKANQKLIKQHSTNRSKEAADNIHCGLQDRSGNLWFGSTGNGVYRYDGKSFINFTVKDGLDSDQILSILEDRLGNIWFGSRNGICRFDGKSITKIPIPGIHYNGGYLSFSPDQMPGTTNAVWSIMQDKKGTIWFGTDDGVYCFNGKTFSRFLDHSNIINQSGLTLKSVQCLLEDANGNIWFGSGPMAFEGICLYDGKTLTSFKPKNQQWIRKIIAGNNGTILFATRQAGIYYYDPAAQTGEKKFNSFPSPPAFVNGSLTNFLQDKAGTFWIASDYGHTPGDTLGGIWRSNISNDKIAETSFTRITNKEVFFVLEDRDRNIWLGTRGTGLYRSDGKTLTDFTE